MRILLVTTDFLPNVSGIATLSYEQAKGLSGLDHEVHVFTTMAGAAEFSASDDFKVTEYNCTDRPVVRLVSFLLGLGNAVREFKPEFIWCSNFRGFGLPVMIIARGYGIPYGIYMHGTELQTENRSMLRHYLLQKVMLKATVLCSNSQNTARLINEKYGASATVVKPGVHPFLPETQESKKESRLLRQSWTQKLSPNYSSDECFVLIAVCRLSDQKGIDLVIKSLSLLDPDIKKRTVFVAVGEGNQLPELKRAVECFDMADHVVFPGPVSREDLPVVLRAADTYIQPSQPVGDFLESFGISFLEAQSAGLACIGTNWGGVPEAVLPDITAKLVATGSVDAIAESIAKVYNDSDWRTNASIQGPRWACENTWDRHSRKLDNLLRPKAT